jgi:predicted nucleic acid-binding protein
VSGPLVLDASVLAKLFLQEADSSAARALVGAGFALAGPELVVVEVASAVLRRYRAGGLTRQEAELALNDVRRYFLRGLTLAPDSNLQPRAEEIALDLRQALRVCFYVALAERLQCDLVTADATLLSRAAQDFPFVKRL